MRSISISLVSVVLVASFVACGGTTPGEGGSGTTSGTSSAGGSGGAGGAGSTGTGATSTESTTSSTGSSSSGSGGGDVLRVDIDGTTTDLSTGASGAYATQLAMNITGGSAPGSGDALGLTIALHAFSPLAAGTFPCKPAGALDQRANLIFTNSTKFKTLSADAFSGDCTVTVTTVEPAGGRIKGTFTATMAGQGPTTSQFTNGSFDLPTK